MPGLAGFVSSGQKISDPRKLLDVFATVHALPGIRFLLDSFSNSDAVILNVATGLLDRPNRQKAPEAEQTRCIFLEGEIYNLKAVARSLGVNLFSDSRAQIAELYDCLETGLSSKLNGEFNIAIFDTQSKKLTIFADHLSTQPLFYYQSNEGLYFGSEKKSIAASVKNTLTVDPVGLLQGFRHIHNLGDRTYIQDLFRLPPGGILQYQNGALHVSKQTPVEFTNSRRNCSVRELIEEWESRLSAAVRRRITGNRKVVVSLSGGLDSRAVVAAIPRDYRPLWARTRGTADLAEVQCAKLVADRLGIEHIIEHPLNFPIYESLHRIVWRTEGETTFMHGFSLLNHALIKQHGDFLAGGYFGDAASGAHVDPRMFIPASLEAFAGRMFDWYDCNQPLEKLALVFSTEFLEATMPMVRDAFIKSHLDFQQHMNVETHQAWDFYNRQTRMTIAAAPVDSHLFQRISPFYDKDLIEFSATIPLKYRIGQTLYKKLIYEMGPEIHDVPNANSLRRLKGSIGANRFDYALYVATKLNSRLWNRLGLSKGTTVPGRNKESPANLIRSDSRFRKLIGDFCESEYFDASVFNREGIYELLRQHYEQDQDHSRVIGQLATFVVALPTFVYNKTKECPVDSFPVASAKK